MERLLHRRAKAWHADERGYQHGDQRQHRHDDAQPPPALPSLIGMLIDALVRQARAYISYLEVRFIHRVHRNVPYFTTLNHPVVQEVLVTERIRSSRHFKSHASWCTIRAEKSCWR